MISQNNDSFRENFDLSNYEKFSIKSFRDIREIANAAPFDRFIGVPVAGDTLNHLGILHGDLLIVKLTQNYGSESNLAVWETRHGWTAKFAYENLDEIVLHNKADWSQTWMTDEVKLIGVVVRVERDL